jgi:hypothetical protein
MCNPRRVRVRATAELQEAWEATIRRAVQLRQTVVGEARARQAVGDSLPEPVRQALEQSLARGTEGWQPAGGGYRCDVPGGYAFYDLQATTLEIVATLEGVVEASGTAEETVSGTAVGQVETEGEGTYYEDWGRRTAQDAERDAQQQAQQRLEQAKRQRVQDEKQRAEQEHAATVERQARQQAEQNLAAQGQAHRAELSRQAESRLQLVGTRCRQQFHRLVAQAWGDAILQYARQHGTLERDAQEGQDRVIEFTMR